MAVPTSIRFDPIVTERLASYVSRHPGASRSSVAARYVDEGLRMDEFPGIHFRDGAAGRRATVVGGPDVWEVVRDVRAVRRAEPDLDDEGLLATLADNTGVSSVVVRAALEYWGAYPIEVDALVSHAERVEREAALAADRARDLFQS